MKIWFANKREMNLHKANVKQNSVSKQYTKDHQLLLRGVGYKIRKKHGLLVDLGYNHFVFVRKPAGVSTVSRKNRIFVSSVNPSQSTNFTRLFRAIRPPDAYKGKGVRHHNEEPVLKVGKVRI